MSPDLLDPLPVPEALRVATSDRAVARAMLDFEAALAAAEAEHGLIDQDTANAIAAACDVDALDLVAIAAAAEDVGNSVAPLVAALRERAGEAGARCPPRRHQPGRARHRAGARFQGRRPPRDRRARSGARRLRHSRRAPPVDDDGGTDAAPARGADDLRPAVGRLAGRRLRGTATARRSRRRSRPAARWRRRDPGGARPRRHRGGGLGRGPTRARLAGDVLAREPGPSRGARSGAGDLLRCGVEDRARRDPALADRGRRGRRVAGDRARRLLDHASKAKPGGLGARPRRRHTGNGPGGHGPRLD